MESSTVIDEVAVLEEHKSMKEAQLSELLRQYDVVDLNYDPHGGSFVILSERVQELAGGSSYPEMATVTPSPFAAWTRTENVPELRDKAGIRTYYDMIRNDGAIRGALRLVKTPVQCAEWYIEPASDSAIDQNIAKFVENCLFEWSDIIWERIIEDCIRCLEYGFFPFEKSYSYDYSKSKFKVQLIPIHPLDIQDWTQDASGKITGIRMEPIYGTSIYERIEIPFSKMVMFIFEMEGGDLRGTSILRSCYKHWYFKEVLYKIDAIQKERHGIGVPVIKLPPGFSKTDRETAEQLGRNLRANERAYITCPANWEIYFAKLEGQPVNIIPSIEHHDRKIYQNILASFMGNEEISTESLDTFYKSTRYMAQGTIAAVFNRELIQQLVDINFVRKGGYPKLKVRRIGEWEDLRTMTFALRNLVGAKVLTPDDPTEEWARSLMSLPPLDKDSARVLLTPPQNSGLTNPSTNVKPPQAKGSRQKDLPYVNTPKANAGTDRSGG